MFGTTIEPANFKAGVNKGIIIESLKAVEGKFGAQAEFKISQKGNVRTIWIKQPKGTAKWSIEKANANFSGIMKSVALCYVDEAAWTDGLAAGDAGSSFEGFVNFVGNLIASNGADTKEINVVLEYKQTGNNFQFPNFYQGSENPMFSSEEIDGDYWDGCINKKMTPKDVSPEVPKDVSPEVPTDEVSEDEAWA